MDEAASRQPGAEQDVRPEVIALDTLLPIEVRGLPKFDKGFRLSVREARLLQDPPWVRTLGKLNLEVTTDGWRFPAIAEQGAPPEPLLEKLARPRIADDSAATADANEAQTRPSIKIRPTQDTVVLKERLLYLLQPPLENLFGSRQVRVPFRPYPYQLEGIAFLMPRNAALLADEMGLGKTMQTILSLRLLFHAGLVRRALLICPKPLVNNWSREIHAWAEDVPFEVIGGDYEARRRSWLVSNCPLKIVNYEILTRDAEFLSEDAAEFDVVVLDEAQRIKNRESKTAQVVRSVRRKRSWALTGTPIENRYEDIVNVFAFVDEDCIPPEATPKRVAEITGEYILRRVKEDVLTDMPPKTIRDAILELTPAQRESYDLAEKEGVYRLNNLGDTITLQHVFELVMRLKQICNFDPVTGQSAKLEQLQADLMEVAESGRKAIVFSQWVEPLRVISEALASIGPLEYHGKIPHNQRQGILDRFKADDSKHVLLMSYGTGSVGLNLQFTNYVFLFDRWWNPAIEDQAINRAHRLGQKSPVTVTRFIAQDTIECRIAEVLEHKRQIFTEMLGNNGVPPSLGMTQDEIFNLFDIGARPKRQAA
jgi:SNF2 family DNA or RNA helicase